MVDYQLSIDKFIRSIIQESIAIHSNFYLYSYRSYLRLFKHTSFIDICNLSWAFLFHSVVVLKIDIQKQTFTNFPYLPFVLIACNQIISSFCALLPYLPKNYQIRYFFLSIFQLLIKVLYCFIFILALSYFSVINICQIVLSVQIMKSFDIK